MCQYNCTLNDIQCYQVMLSFLDHRKFIASTFFIKPNFIKPFKNAYIDALSILCHIRAINYFSQLIDYMLIVIVQDELSKYTTTNYNEL